MAMYDKNLHSSSPQDNDGELNIPLSRGLGITSLQRGRVGANKCGSFYICAEMDFDASVCICVRAKSDVRMNQENSLPPLSA